MNKIKTDMDYYSIKVVAQIMVALLWGRVPGLDVERLVLQEWWMRVSSKYNWIDGMGGCPSFKVSLRPSEALSLHRVLQVVPLPEDLDIDRQSLMAQIEPKLIPFQSSAWGSQLKSLNP